MSEKQNLKIVSDLFRGNGNYLSKIDKQLLARLHEKGQEPKAVVVSCSDSRVPVELIFDMLEPGQLFVIRVAGNVVSGPEVIGSIEFAVEQLQTPHIILLGHTGCGAVQAHIDGSFKSRTISRLCKKLGCKSLDMKLAVIENLEHQFQRILRIGCVNDRIKNGKLGACSMVYEMENGTINILNRTDQDTAKVGPYSFD